MTTTKKKKKKKKKKSRPTGKRAKKRSEPPDPYYDLVVKHWANIVKLYLMFEERRPVMLYDIQDEKIYAYPYKDFKADMSEQSQKMLEEQYKEAINEDKIVVFVRDNETRRLVSYCLA